MMYNYPRRARTTIVETALLIFFAIILGGIVQTMLAGAMDIILAAFK